MEKMKKMNKITSQNSWSLKFEYMWSSSSIYMWKKNERFMWNDESPFNWNKKIKITNSVTIDRF